MSELLNIAYIQPDIKWLDVEGNLRQYDNYMSQIAGADLIVLPEMFASGFTKQNDGIVQTMDGKVVNWMRQKAKEKDAAIIGSQMISENGLCFNRLVIAKPDGNIDWYDKRHLFRMGCENETLTSGNEIKIFDYKGWHIRPTVCYDLRFPVWLRNVANRYDLLVCVADWPSARHNIFETLLKARAIENQCYVVGVNRVGSDGLDIKYSGGSCVIDMYGSTIIQTDSGIAGIGQTTVSLAKLNAFRDNFPVALDADKFCIG